MAVLLDTCAIAEIVQRDRNPGFETSAESIDHNGVQVSVLTVFETFTGVFRLPTGQRRDRLEHSIKAYFSSIKNISRDTPKAELAAEMVASEQAKGRSLKNADACIAATAFLENLTLITRDRDFDALPTHPPFSTLKIENPWSP